MIEFGRGSIERVTMNRMTRKVKYESSVKSALLRFDKGNIVLVL